MAARAMAEFLGCVDLFEHVEEQVIDGLAASARTLSLSAGETLFEQGDPAGYLFVVRRGGLDVLKRVTDGREVWLRRMGPGEAGGLTSVVVSKERSATLRAAVDSVVVAVDRERMLELMDDHPDLARGLVAVLSAKVRAKTARLAGLVEQAGEAGRTPVAVYDAKPYDRNHLDLAQGDDLAFRYFESRLRPETVPLAAGFPAVCAFVNDDLGAATLEGLADQGVGLVALRCAGFNQVDLAAAARLGIDVVRVPAYSPHAVAEHTVGLILALNRRLHRAHNRVREHNFSLAGLVGFDLHGRTAGVVGLGTIGRELAKILVGFGMRVLAHDPYCSPEVARAIGAGLVDLDDLLRESDVVSLHSPLTPETFHLIDRSRLALMKPGAMLVNTSRGGLVDTVALIEALKSGHLGAAGLDVYEEESGTFFEDLSDRPITDDVLARLLTFPNVLVTSHQAYLTEDALTAIAETTAANIREYLNGRRGARLSNVVQP
jgi:D-lactate dehydrogenase